MHTIARILMMLCFASCSNEDVIHRSSGLDRTDVDNKSYQINGGKPLSVNSFPAVGAVITYFELSDGTIKKSLCTGTLICSSLVLTAAHCSVKIGDMEDGKKVVAIHHSEFRTDKKPIQEYKKGVTPKVCANVRPSSAFCSKIDVVEVPVGWASNPHVDMLFKASEDIAVAKLAIPATAIKPLPLSCKTPPMGEQLKIIGYGKNSQWPGRDGRRQQGAVTFSGTETIEHGAPNDLPGEIIHCEPGPDSANVGDSGGPLIYEDSVIGVAHSGSIFGGMEYASIDFQQSWLKDMLVKYCPGNVNMVDCDKKQSSTTRELTVDKTGSGTVIAPGINCGADCDENYALNSDVTLTAFPDPGYEFKDWSGACKGTSPTCTIKMDIAKRVTANFMIGVPAQTQSLIVSTLGSGYVTSDVAGIDCGSDCRESYPQGKRVTLTATPSNGSVFMGWTGGSCTGTGTCTVTMNESLVITAFFEERPTTHKHTLTVSKTGAGKVVSSPSGIDCGSRCTADFGAQSFVTLNAIPDPGVAFVSWGGACSGSASTCTVTMTGAKNVTAKFQGSLANLKVTKSGDGSGVVRSSPAGIDCGTICSKDFSSDDPVTLTATADLGSEFSGWTGACAGVTGKSCTLTMNASKTASAKFTLVGTGGPKPCSVNGTVTFSTSTGTTRSINFASCNATRIQLKSPSYCAYDVELLGVSTTPAKGVTEVGSLFESGGYLYRNFSTSGAISGVTLSLRGTGSCPIEIFVGG